MTKLRIAHVTGESGFSGGEVQVFLLMEGLRARGHENLLVCPPGSQSEGEARRRSIDVVCVAMRNDLSVTSAARVARHLVGRKPSLVHCHTGRANWIGGLAARLAGVPALSTRRMDRLVKRSWRTRWLYGSLMRRVVAISPAVERRLLEGGVPADRVRRVWSAIDPGALTPSASREELREKRGVPGETRVVLTAANLVERKGIDVLLDAFARMHTRADAVLWIAGDGDRRASLEARVEDLGLGQRVSFLGRRDDVADLIECCDLFALPSRHEGLGVAALEAMARGRAVVASAVGGLAELVRHEETGLLVAPGDANALARALEALTDDPERAERLGAAGARRVDEEFHANRMVEAYEALYGEILAEAKRSNP